MRNHWYIPAAVLLVLAIVGFFAGWMQLSLGPDIWGVAFTRSKGYEETAIDPAGFTWRWRHLVPGLLTVYKIPLKPVHVDMKLKALLPSSVAYATVMPDHPDLSVEIRLSARYRIRPSALPGLVERSGLRPDTLSDWHEQQKAEIEWQATEIATALAAGTDGTSASNGAALAAAIARRLPEKFPHLEFFSLTPSVVQMPDPQLYKRLSAAYLRSVSERETAIADMMPRLAAEEAAQRLSVQKHSSNIEMLEKYGELLEKHPALIKFLFITTSKSEAGKLQTLDILDRLSTLD